MHAEGKTFAFVKGTEGLTGPDDTTMTNNVTRATAAGILRSSDLQSPLSGWTVAGTAVEGPPGTFQFTNTNSPAFTRGFYKARSP
jgi:hypothetical protein